MACKTSPTAKPPGFAPEALRQVAQRPGVFLRPSAVTPRRNARPVLSAADPPAGHDGPTIPVLALDNGPAPFATAIPSVTAVPVVAMRVDADAARPHADVRLRRRPGRN
jgi:hypothetical protein